LETVHEVLKGHPGFMHVAMGQAGALPLERYSCFVMAEITTGKFLSTPNQYENVDKMNA